MATRSWSPTKWPWVSLTPLKSSRSSSRTAPTPPTRATRAWAWARRSSKSARLARPVSGSWSAWCDELRGQRALVGDVALGEDEVQDPPVGVARGRAAHLDVDDATVLAQVALLVALLLDLARDRARERGLGDADVVGVGEGGRVLPDELVAAEPDHLAERVVDRDDAVVHVGEGSSAPCCTRRRRARAARPRRGRARGSGAPSGRGPWRAPTTRRRRAPATSRSRPRARPPRRTASTGRGRTR